MSKRITVLAIGTRGDVQPLLALAVGLQRTGRHLVRLIAPDDFGALATDVGTSGPFVRVTLAAPTIASGLAAGCFIPIRRNPVPPLGLSLGG